MYTMYTIVYRRNSLLLPKQEYTLVWVVWEAISRAQPLVVRFSLSSIAFGGLNEEVCVCVCISFEIEVIETSG